MKNILGTIYLMDEDCIDVLRKNLTTMPPPGGFPDPKATILCIDMSDEDDHLEKWFPHHTQKGTLLLPPPSALYKQIDGDQEGFITEYNNYLDNDQSVKDFVATMLYYMHIGGNILLYTPTEINSGAVWINVLELWFYSRYGITMGTAPDAPFFYDQNYDYIVANELYTCLGMMSALDFVYSVDADLSKVTPANMQRLYQDLQPLVMEGEDPFSILYFIRGNLLSGYPPAYKPAVVFGR